MRATVNNIYQYAKTNSNPLLGSNSFDFWQPYVTAYNVYDRYFRDKFLSWFYWLNFDETATIENIYDDFVDAVQAHLTINSKRYSELYRVQVLAADAYDIVNNYDLNETHSTTRSDNATDVSGARSDSKSGTNILGSHTDSKTGSNIFGPHTDSKSGSNTSGEREDTQSGSATDGARQDTGTTGVGAQTNTTEKQIEGFNSSSYTDADKTIETNGARSDTTTVNKGEQTNTTSETLNKGEQTDTYSEDITIGSHTDTLSESFTIGEQSNSISETANKGAQTDTHTGSATESISIRRYGNIGVQTAADVIGGHVRLWDSFNFYKMIFDEIAKEFLLLDQNYDYDGVYTESGGGSIDITEIMNELHIIENMIDLTAKTSQLTPLAKSSELANLAKTSDLSDLATKTDLDDLAKSSELADLAKTSDLSTLATSTEAGRIELSVEALRASTLSYKNDIINSIEGVSSEDY